MTQQRPSYRQLAVQAVVEETHDAKSVLFAPPADAGFDYRPGQFLTLRLPIGGRHVPRCYSLASTPGLDPVLRVTIKRVEGGRGSNWICDHVRAGDTLEVLPPAGSFTPRSLDGELLLFAGGSGITPVFSILRAVLLQGTGRCLLVYANRDERSVIFRRELDALAGAHPARFSIVHWLDSVQGLPSPQQLADIARGARGHAYICGPGPFMQACETALQARGLDPGEIHVERFSSLPDEEDSDAVRAGAAAAAAAGASVLLRLNGQEHELALLAGETLLDAALRAGLDAPFSCQSGGCSTCVCRIVEGKVDMLANTVLSAGEVERGMALACQSVPRTARVVAEF